jgi:MFS family permease
MHEHDFRKRERLSSNIRQLSAITLFSYIGIALVGTIWAIYMESIVHNPSTVGLISTWFGVAGIFAFLFFIPIIEKHNKTKILALVLLLYAISYFLFAFVDDIFALIILGTLIYVIASARVSTIGIIMRNKSKDNEVSKNTGVMYTVFNFAWLVGPVVAGFVAQKIGIRFVFIIAGILVGISFILLKVLGLNDSGISKRPEKNVFKLTKEFFARKKFVLSYIIHGGVNFWWAFIYIYIPMFIVDSGRSDLVVGYFLAGVIAPLIFLEYPIGILASKFGFKKMFFRGFLIVAIAAGLCFLINDFYAILILLVLGSVGMAMLEPTTEAYFFDITTKSEKDKFYGVQNTTVDVNYAVSLFAVAMIIKFLPFKYSFIFISAVMLAFALISLRIKDVFEKKRG